MTTTEKEKYKCLLPSLTAGDEVSRINETVNFIYTLHRYYTQILRPKVIYMGKAAQFCHKALSPMSTYHILQVYGWYLRLQKTICASSFFKHLWEVYSLDYLIYLGELSIN